MGLEELDSRNTTGVSTQSTTRVYQAAAHQQRGVGEAADSTKRASVDEDTGRASLVARRRRHEADVPTAADHQAGNHSKRMAPGQ